LENPELNEGDKNFINNLKTFEKEQDEGKLQT
jgi:hypothetical protein